MGNFIHQLRARPEHVRERIAYGTATLITAVVAGIWITTSLTTTGILAPARTSDASFAENTSARTPSTSAPVSSFLGSAVSAFTGSTPAKPAHLEIINVSKSSTLSSSVATATKRTVIPF